MSEEDLQLLITLDDPWNAGECDTFNGNHDEQTGTYRLGERDPTKSGHDRRADKEHYPVPC